MEMVYMDVNKLNTYNYLYSNTNYDAASSSDMTLDSV